MWQLAVGEFVMTQQDITAGEEAAVLAMVTQAGIPHAWAVVHPAHCPACLIAHHVVVLTSRGDLPQADAAALVNAVSSRDLITNISAVPEAAAEPLEDPSPTGG